MLRARDLAQRQSAYLARTRPSVQFPEAEEDEERENKREVRKKRGGRERKKRDLLTQRSEVDFRCLNCISPSLVCSLTASDRYRTYLISHFRPVSSHFHPVLPPLCTPFDPFFLLNYSPSYFFILFVTHRVFIFFLKINKKNSDY